MIDKSFTCAYNHKFCNSIHTIPKKIDKRARHPLLIYFLHYFISYSNLFFKKFYQNFEFHNHTGYLKKQSQKADGLICKDLAHVQ